MEKKVQNRDGHLKNSPQKDRKQRHIDGEDHEFDGYDELIAHWIARIEKKQTERMAVGNGVSASNSYTPVLSDSIIKSDPGWKRPERAVRCQHSTTAGDAKRGAFRW